jgi:RimJ/RimL family protein N-acetyltransferase
MRLKPYYLDPKRCFALREMQADDLAGLEDINKLLFYPYLRHICPPAEFLDKHVLRPVAGIVFHGIVTPSDYSSLIGLVGAAIISACAEDPIDSVDVGYALLPAHQGRGIARSAVVAFLPRMLTPQITEVTATVAPENLASIRLLEACGFKRIGVPQPSRYPGDPDNPAHYEAGVLQCRPRVSYRADADAFR